MNNLKLSSREKKILLILCKNKKYITIKDISKQINTSSRTVSRDLKRIDRWLKNKEIFLEKKPRVGLKLEISFKKRKSLEKLLKDQKVYKIYKPKKRQEIIFIELLKKKKPVKLFYFANMFNVSNATISNDLNTLENVVTEFNLKLKRKSGVGISISGKEKYIRKAMISLLHKNFDNEKINKMIRNEDDTKITEIQNHTMNFLNKKYIKPLKEILESAEERLNLKLADSAYIGLLIHLSIAIERISNNEIISIKENFFKDLKTLNEYKIALDISKDIKEKLKINFSKYEVGYIAMHLKGSKLRNGISDETIFLKDEILGNYGLTTIVKDMLEIVKQNTGYDLSSDSDLLIGLVSHLRPALSRIKMDLSIRNPLLDEIKNKYSEVFEISKKCIKVIENWSKVKVPEEEIGFIAMHIGAAIEKKKNSTNNKFKVIVACASGIGTSSLLASELSKNFENFEITKTSSIRKLKDKEIIEDIDLIISTVNIKDINSPLVVVSPLLLKKDIEKINKKIENIDKKSNYKKKTEKFEKDLSHYEKFNKVNKGIYELLNNYFFYGHIKEQSKEKIIQNMVNRLFNSEKVRTSVFNILLEREKIGTTVLGDKDTLLLHGKSSEINHLYFGVIRLSKELKQKVYDEEVKIKQMVVMLAPENVDKISLKLLNAISKNLVENENFIKSIKQGDHQEIYNILTIILNDFMQKFLK